MRRHGGDLYERIYDYENLRLAYRKASFGRRYDPAVLRFHACLDENLIELQNELIWKTYKPGPYSSFLIHEPKERLIYVSPFRDRVLHHAIMNIVEPIWDSLFIDDSFACRKGKGTHAALYRTDGFLRRAFRRAGSHVYCFKGDISKFFPSINHHVLMAVIRQKIKCRDTLWLFDQIIFAAGDRADPASCNMPIGNLISQWAANLYLHELDCFVKHDLHIKDYIRYMDDFIILSGDKVTLHVIKREIECFVESRLKLKLNPKSDIFPASRGIDFLGYRTWVSHRILRKSSLVRATKRFKRLSQEYGQGLVALPHVHSSVMSWLGHCGHAHVLNGKIKCLEALLLRRPSDQTG